MNTPQKMIIIFSIYFCMLATISEITVSAAPISYSDYENVRDLYEYLVERQLLADAYAQAQTQKHQMVRKNSRSPSLRLRFGRRSDPTINQVPHQTGNEDHTYQISPDLGTNE